MTTLGEHAVVLGASMGGLLAARVLADFYETVTVVERDVLPETSANRRGVPQGRHVHLLLGRGSQVLDELFPGFLDELVAAGAPSFDGDMSKLYLSNGGHLFPRSGRAKDVPFFLPSRPLLESHVRRRMRAVANVTVLDGHDVVELTSTPPRDRVTGALVRARPDGSERVLRADLVVDAMGRGARTPAFLEGLGYGRPAEDQLGMRLAYSSQLLRIPPGMLNELMVIIGPVPGRPTGMALFGNENNTWMFSVIGMVGREPPDELAEMLAFVEDFAPAHVLAAIRAGEPLAEVARYRMPSSQWRRYDKMRRFPAGLLVFGDAICSFNPVYGQGMTVAALEALALQRCLRRGEDGLARRHFQATAKAVGVAWQMATGADLSLPEVEGPRPLPVRIANNYVDRVLAAAESDIVVAEQFARVIAFLDPPTSLFHPAFIARVATTNLRRRKGDHAATELAAIR
ncbi:MAG TPA: 2-polyprenyl-6-methoxyphenol hydroxylase-like oxidoreductase [Mycobacterium sp.]|nr:2-polyprenyl-6-methoxyphenol hydroxylase-like oxidoreductase [Mycobacterium sp.]